MKKILIYGCWYAAIFFIIVSAWFHFIPLLVLFLACFYCLTDMLYGRWKKVVFKHE